MQLGIDDPEAWLDSLTDQQWSTWQAFNKIEQPFAEWERHAAVMNLLEHLYAFTVNSNLPEERKADRITPSKPEAWLPKHYIEKDEPTFAEKMQAMAKVMESKYGNHD